MIAGPSHSLRHRSGPKQRAVNILPVPVEAPGEPSRTAFRDFPGLVEFADLGAPVRGAINSNGRRLVAAGSSLLELVSSGASVSLGVIGSVSGWVDFAANATQIFLTDSTNLHVLNRATNALTTTVDYPGGPRIDVLKEFLFMVDDRSGRVWWSDVGDGTNIDGLSFATAESAPDNLTACIVSNEELLLFGKSTIEPWRVIGGEEVITKSGSTIEVGCESPYSVRRLDNSVFFVGSSEEFGQGVVYRLNGYTPQRISTMAEEEKLGGIDLSGAYAWAALYEGDAIYCLQVPALDTTLVYNVKTQLWSEAAELVNGEYTKHRGNVHMFAFNKHLLGADDGKLYELSSTAYSNAGDVLCRSRVTNEFFQPGRAFLRHAEVQCICDAGYGGQMMIRWADGRKEMGDWEYIPLGITGNFDQFVGMRNLGAAEYRTYEIRVTDEVPWNPSDLLVRVV